MRLTTPSAIETIATLSRDPGVIAGGRFALSPVSEPAGMEEANLPGLRAVRGPFPDIPLLPTSGPMAETLAGYFEAGGAAVGVGGAAFFPSGWTPESVEAAARCGRSALDALRSV